MMFLVVSDGMQTMMGSLGDGEGLDGLLSGLLGEDGSALVDMFKEMKEKMKEHMEEAKERMKEVFLSMEFHELREFSCRKYTMKTIN